MIIINMFYLTLLLPLITLVFSTSHQVLKFSIDEKLPMNSLAVDLAAELKIQTPSKFQLFELLAVQKNLLNIDPEHGHLRTNSILDREAMCRKQQCSCESCELLFQLIIETSGKRIEKILEIKLRDRNDHIPSFDDQSGPHRIHIKENVPLGYRIVLPSANDPDEGSNSIQSYTLTGTNSDDFDIDFTTMTTPFLIVRSSLDRQRISSYALTLIAADHGEPSSLSNSLQLTIEILPNTKSIPTFVQSIYTIDLREDTPIENALLTVTAIADDASAVTYELLTESPFVIEKDTGLLKLNETLDYEREDFYRLTVKATANSIPTYAVVFVRVIDVNDNRVTIRMYPEGNATIQEKSIDQLTITLDEGMAIGTKLARAILNDFDSTANGNPYLQLRTDELPLPLVYKLIYQNNFQNTKFYWLIINQELDRELKSTYNRVQLIAHDSGTPTLHSQVHLTINLSDINDCTPTFHNNATIYSINENNPIGLILGRLSAHDCDANDNARINYRLLDETNLLTVNEETGEIRVNQSIDFEKINIHRRRNLTTIDLEFTVEARDHGQPSRSSLTKIILRIHDLNDNVPEFNPNQSYNWTFTNDQLRPNAVLGRVIANDQDSGLSGLIRYNISSLSSCLQLEINALGFVYLPSDVSFVSCATESFEFEITASDSNLPQYHSSQQILKINIESNQNDHRILPPRLPLNVQQTVVDVNSIGNVAFVLDLSPFANETYEPKLFFNNTHLSSSWHVSSNGEISLISHPYSSSYILSLFIVDDYTQLNISVQIHIRICNSSITDSCNADRMQDHRTMLVYAISIALVSTVTLIIVFSLIICLCCRKSTKKLQNGLSSIHRQSFLHYMEEFNSDRTENSSDQMKSSSNSTIRDDDHDSACIIPVHSASSSSSSSGLATHTDSWRQSPEIQRNTLITTHPPYHYDLKLAEFLRQNQYPPCVHLNEGQAVPQSASTDYGFSSLEISVTSSSSTLPHHTIDIDRSSVPNRLLTLQSFVSSRECVV